MRLLLCVVVATALAATPAAARETCKVRAPVKALELPSKDGQQDVNTLVALSVSLAGKAVTHKSLLKAKPACAPIPLETKGQAFSVFEPTSNELALVVRSSNPDDAVFFVAPFIDVVAFVNAPPGKGAVPAGGFVLGVSDAKATLALRLYPDLPDNEALKTEVNAVLEGQLRPLASYDTRTKSITLNAMPSDEAAAPAATSP